VSRIRASSSSGSSPWSIARKFAACESFGFGGTKSWFVRARWYIAISVGILAISRYAFRRFASSDSSQPSGS
jgi:hypothetical protein